MSTNDQFEIENLIHLNTFQDEINFEFVFLIDQNNNKNELINLLNTLYLVNKKKKYRASIVLFNNTNTPNVILHHISNLDEIYEKINSLIEIEFTQDLNSNFNAGLTKAKNILDSILQTGFRTKKVIFLFSDAIKHSESKSAKIIANKMKKTGISIISFSLGNSWNEVLLQSLVSDKLSFNSENISLLNNFYSQAFNTLTKVDLLVKIGFKNLYSIGESILLYIELTNYTGDSFSNIRIIFDNNDYFENSKGYSNCNLDPYGKINFECKIQVNSMKDIKSLANNCVLYFKIKTDEKELLCSSNKVVLSPMMFMKDIVTMESKLTNEMRILFTGKSKSGKSDFINNIIRLVSMNPHINTANVGTQDNLSFTKTLHTFKIEDISNYKLKLKIVLRDKWGWYYDNIDNEIKAFKKIMDGNVEDGCELQVACNSDKVNNKQINDIAFIVVDIRDVVFINNGEAMDLDNKTISEEIKIKLDEFNLNKDKLLHECFRLHNEVSKNNIIIVTHSDLIKTSSSLDNFDINSSLTKLIHKSLTTNNTFSFNSNDVHIISNQLKGEMEVLEVSEFRRGLSILKLFKCLYSIFDNKISFNKMRYLNEDINEEMTIGNNSIRVNFSLISSEKKDKLILVNEKNIKENFKEFEDKIKKFFVLNQDVKLKYKLGSSNKEIKKYLVINLDEIFNEEYYQSLKNLSSTIYIEIKK